VQEGWIKLHNEVLHNLYASTNIIRVMKSKMGWVGYVARMGEMRISYKIFVGKPEGKGLLGRSRRRWDDNIRMNLREIGWEYVVQCRDQWRAHVKTVMNIRVP
jgi:hypothetical protein